jgi:autotransporter-associated beta strand protein
VISGTGNIIQNAPGTLTLSGANAYTGTTSVVGGVLAVNGSIAASSLTSVQSGGTLIGTGTVGATQVNAGGVFAPGSGTAGTSMIVSGNLAFQSGAVYLVQINPTSASFANVNGIATLGGATVNAVFAPGSYVEKRYTILSTTGGVSGTFAPTVATTNLPSNFRTQLNYDGGHAFLDLTLGSASGVENGGLNANQSAVNNAITGFFNSNGSIPGVFGSLTPAGLTQASGENATAVQQSTFSAMSQFINLLTGPFFSHEGGVTGDAPNAPAYADDSLDANAYAGAKSSTTVNDAYGLFTKTPLRRAHDPRWSVWAAGFGGTQQSDGNAVTGSNNASSTVFGTAVGLNYFLSPDTLVGFALGGGGTRFAVTGFGNGRSDLFQTGLFVRHATGAAYVSAALGYGWQDVTTDRTVTIAGADRLRAEFNANAWTGRVETGYRFVAPLIGLGITPYAAGQSTALVLPGYAEQVVSGAQTFALGYNAKTVIDSRTELGVRTDRTIALVDAALVMRGRFAWVHDFNPDRSVAAAFQTLPGAGFVVAGAAQAPNSALAALSAQVTWLNGWSAATSFEADASSVTRSYAGKAVVRAVW